MESIRKVKNQIFCCLSFADGTLTGIADSIFNTFDKIIIESDISYIFKKIFHAKTILFFYLIINNFFLLYNNSKTYNLVSSNLPTISPVSRNISDPNANNTIMNDNEYLVLYHQIKNNFHFFFVLSFAVLVALIVYLQGCDWSSQVIPNNPELENYISKNRKELEKNKCQDCKVTKVMRSFHCFYCQKCIARFEFHSHWLNICIGAQNYFLYLLILISINFYFSISLLFLLFHIFMPQNNPYIINDFKGKYFALHFWTVLMVYATVKILLFSKDTFKNAFANLTFMESENWRRIPYLWVNMRKDFFNPFNKGIVNNLKEYYFSFKNNKELFIGSLGLEIPRNMLSFNNNVLTLGKKENENNSKVKSEHFTLDNSSTVLNSPSDSITNSEKRTNDKSLSSDIGLDAYDNLALNDSECLSDRYNPGTNRGLLALQHNNDLIENKPDTLNEVIQEYREKNNYNNQSNTSIAKVLDPINHENDAIKSYCDNRINPANLENIDTAGNRSITECRS